jgi:hypothetical protein
MSFPAVYFMALLYLLFSRTYISCYFINRHIYLSYVFRRMFYYFVVSSVASTTVHKINLVQNLHLQSQGHIL